VLGDLPGGDGAVSPTFQREGGQGGRRLQACLGLQAAAGWGSVNLAKAGSCQKRGRGGESRAFCGNTGEEHYLIFPFKRRGMESENLGPKSPSR
jgi:hypothetical protein